MRVYLDYNATTPVDPQVFQAMRPYFSDQFGNASSIHSVGQEARSGMERARDQVAALVGANSAEIVFTSGGTEADNLAIFGVTDSFLLAANSPRERHVITTAIEHHAVLNAGEALQARGMDVTYVPVSHEGIVDPDDIRRALRPETILITVMHANNELGTIQPIEEIGRIAAEADVYFHVDAVQSAGKIPVDVNALRVDLLSISAHKIYGPKGVGALYVRAGTPIEPQIRGGHHERDRRPGTENVPGIVGLGAAAALAKERLRSDSQQIAGLRDYLENSLLSNVPDAVVNGTRQLRVPNTTNFTFRGAEGEALEIALDLKGVACSTGAACSSGAVEPSHVLIALGLACEDARSSLRFSLGRHTSRDEIDYALSVIPGVVERLRELSPTYKRTAAV